MKQLGLGFYNYHDTHGTYPVNYALRGAPGAPGTANPQNILDSGRSWISFTLPYVDQAPLYNQINFSAPRFNNTSSNWTVAQTVIPVLLCPSDADNGNGRLASRADIGGAANFFGVNNYKACAGSNWMWGLAGWNCVFTTVGRNAGTRCTGNSPPNGADGLNRGNGILASNQNGGNAPTRVRDVTDGTTNTFAIGENLPGWTNWAWWWNPNAATATCAIPLNQLLKVPKNLGNWPNNYAFASRHVGGGHFAMADGSVRFISENISLATYRALATISATEITGEF